MGALTLVPFSTPPLLVCHCYCVFKPWHLALFTAITGIPRLLFPAITVQGQVDNTHGPLGACKLLSWSQNQENNFLHLGLSLALPRSSSEGLILVQTLVIWVQEVLAQLTTVAKWLNCPKSPESYAESDGKICCTGHFTGLAIVQCLQPSRILDKWSF